MPGPLAKTLELLTTTANPFAGEVLVAALDVPIPGIVAEAVRSIVNRGNVPEQMEVIRRYPRFSPEIREPIKAAAPSMVPAILQCLIERGELESAALELARAGEALGVVETLLDIHRDSRTDLHEEAIPPA